MTASLVTPGHIKCLKYLVNKGEVYIGLISDKGLEGYKPVIVPYEERRFVMKTIAQAIGNTVVVKQDSLSPVDNLKKYFCDALASGDGFEDSELEAIEKLKLKKINIRFKGEKEKKFSSSRIIKNILDTENVL